MLRRQFSCIVICCTFPLEKQSEFRARHFDEVYRLCKNRKAPDNERSSISTSVKQYDKQRPTFYPDLSGVWTVDRTPDDEISSSIQTTYIPTKSPQHYVQKEKISFKYCLALDQNPRPARVDNNPLPITSRPSEMISQKG